MKSPYLSKYEKIVKLFVGHSSFSVLIALTTLARNERKN